MKSTYKDMSVDWWREDIKENGGIRPSVKCFNELLADEFTGKAKESGVRALLKRTKPKKDDAQTEKQDTRPIASGTINPPDSRRRNLIGKKFVFTAAQNNTFIHEDFFASLRKFCEHNEANLYVSQFTYNKSGFQNSTKEGSTELWYDERLSPYFLNTSVEVAEGLLFCGELDVLPTAGNPLSGFETYCFGNSGIIPHAKVALKSLPRLRGEDARFLYTTGAVTLRNYIQRKAGQKADFHHVFGALFVEVDDKGVWFARQLIADDSGSFYDLDKLYTPEDVSSGHEVVAINYGDIHVEKSDSQVSAASWSGEDSLAKRLSPTYQFVHDLTDFSARNHHNIKDPFFLARTYYAGGSLVEDGLKQSSKLLAELSTYGLVIVVESNHHEAYERWLKEADIKTDPANAEFYYRSLASVHQAIQRQDVDYDVYEWALKQYDPLTNVIFLKADDSFVICNDPTAEEEGKIIGGVECGMHGHRGANGARGSSNSFKRVGRKCNVGHSHSAEITDGVYTAGVSGLLDMGYNRGPSSWSHSHIVTYPNGKRTIITIKQGKWKA